MEEAKKMEETIPQKKAVTVTLSDLAELRMLTNALRDYADRIDALLDSISGQAMKEGLTEQDKAEEKIKELAEEILKRQRDEEKK
jgi:hypothetical protein